MTLPDPGAGDFDRHVLRGGLLRHVRHSRARDQQQTPAGNFILVFSLGLSCVGFRMWCCRSSAALTLAPTGCRPTSGMCCPSSSPVINHTLPTLIRPFHVIASERCLPSVLLAEWTTGVVTVVILHIYGVDKLTGDALSGEPIPSRTQPFQPPIPHYGVRAVFCSCCCAATIRVLILFSLSVTSFAYAFSFLFKSPSSGTVLIFTSVARSAPRLMLLVSRFAGQNMMIFFSFVTGVILTIVTFVLDLIPSVQVSQH